MIHTHHVPQISRLDDPGVDEHGHCARLLDHGTRQRRIAELTCEDGRRRGSLPRHRYLHHSVYITRRRRRLYQATGLPGNIVIDDRNASSETKLRAQVLRVLLHICSSEISLLRRVEATQAFRGRKMTRKPNLVHCEFRMAPQTRRI